MNTPDTNLLGIFVMFAFASVVVGGAFFVGRFLGPRRLFGPKIMSYECGITPTGEARDRLSVKYYLVAILFLLFDLEAAFLLPVALAWPELKAVGLVGMLTTLFFLLFFVLSIWYEYRAGAVEWEPS
jgi:NADH-quinone oxidoreductase subunit A